MEGIVIDSPERLYVSNAISFTPVFQNDRFVDALHILCLEALEPKALQGRSLISLCSFGVCSFYSWCTPQMQVFQIIDPTAMWP